jgi:hypothetical protein
VETTTKKTIDVKKVEEIANIWSTNNAERIAETFAQDGKIRSFKPYSDNLTVFQQLGLAPQQ